MSAGRASVVAAVAVAVLASLAPIGAAEARTVRVAAQPVSFQVQNVNRSLLACATDGAPYEVKGHLVGPRTALARATARKRPRRSGRAAALYLHGLGFGEWFWRFTAVPGLDYATAQAKRGHVSVVIDRLGYDATGRPPGTQSCIGGQADIAHQVVQHLREGTYSVTGGKARRFKRIALVGHSAGGEIANVAAYSFRDVNALAVLSFSYSNLPRAQLALGPTRALCQAGGEPSEPGGAPGYAFYGNPTAADFESIMFGDATRPVIDAAAGLRNRDPCGDTNSIIPSLLQQRKYLPRVRVPVLVLCGTRDALYSRLGCEAQVERYTTSRRVKLELVRGAGHALTIERTARVFRRTISRWLAANGF